MGRQILTLMKLYIHLGGAEFLNINGLEIRTPRQFPTMTKTELHICYRMKRRVFGEYITIYNCEDRIEKVINKYGTEPMIVEI